MTNDAGDNWQPAQYHRFRAERSAPFFDLLALVETDDARMTGPRVVDLGCGSGELTAVAHERLGASSTLGADSSAAMLAEAARHTTAALTFAAGDIGEFPGDDQRRRFDVVLANAALQWVPDHRAVLARWTSALAPTGQLAVQVPSNADHPAHLLADEVAREPVFADAFAAHGGVPTDAVWNVLPPDEYARLLDDLGYARQHVRLQVYPHRLESTAAVVEWMKGTTLTRFRASLDDHLYEEYLARYRARLLEELGDQRPFFYPFKRVLLWGRLPS